jgi:hypothetical protein
MNIFSTLSINGILVNKNVKETTIEGTGEIVKTGYLFFMMNNQKGLENVKVKDSDLTFQDLEIGKPCTVPIRVTMSQMGTTFYEVASQVKLDFSK